MSKKTKKAIAPAAESRSADLYLGSPELADFFGMAGSTDSGVAVNESKAIGLSAVFRAVSLISGTVASLPLHSYQDQGGVRSRTDSFLDNPGGPAGLTQFEWTQTVTA